LPPPEWDPGILRRTWYWLRKVFLKWKDPYDFSARFEMDDFSASAVAQRVKQWDRLFAAHPPVGPGRPLAAGAAPAVSAANQS
jgi:hypothetical protein